MLTLFRISLVVLLLGVAAPSWSKGAGDAADWPFFAFDNGVGRDVGWTPTQQAALLAKLGYDGVGYTGLDHLPERIEAMKSKGLRIFSVYEWFDLDKAEPIPADRLARLEQLEGTDAILWLNFVGDCPEPEAVGKLCDLADAAAKHEIRVAIYPHDNTYVSTGKYALRLAKLVDRDNLGMSINLCHELKAGHGADLLSLVKQSPPHLFLVSINGTDELAEPRLEKNWDRLIRPLGQGDFDLVPFLSELKANGYRGPVGLQCYQVRGVIDENLASSRAAWNDLKKTIAEPLE
jgi:sugar phosphate isomerase/epimerase